MRFEEFNQEDILHLFNVITKEGDQLLFLVDHALRVQYMTQAFSHYFKLEVSDIIDREFGEALGCANRQKDNRDCAYTSYCSTCEIRKNLHLAFSGSDEIIEFDLVREFLISDEKLVKHLIFKIIPIELHESQFALCLISDKRKHDDLTMVTNPNASI